MTSIDDARALIGELVASGVRDFVLCPGSRSAPLAYALWELESGGSPIRLHVRHDERSAGFMALGFGLADPAHPAAVVTTSGTAVANLAPAVAESSHAGVPLLLLTADRPPELAGTWANQTMKHQAGTFHTLVRRLTWDTEPGSGVVAVLEARGELGSRPGPVHLNVRFREPLVPQAEPVTPAEPPAIAPGGHPAQVDVRLEPGLRTVVVAGDQAGPAARVLAEEAGWPLLAEPSSGALGGVTSIVGYRLLLPRFAERVQRVVVFGHPTLSRPVTRLLADLNVELVHVVAHPDQPGSERGYQQVHGTVTADHGDPAWLDEWLTAATALRATLTAELPQLASGTGLAVAHEVVTQLRAGENLMVAASNPIRDVDLLSHLIPEGVSVYANRGLAGIDGTIATAMGVALATGRATRVLTGDLAFLHDANGLFVPPAERDRPLQLQVTVANDDGGGIFATLEHGQREQSFERIFGTPHGLDLATVAAGQGATVVGEPSVDVPQGVSVLVRQTSRAGLKELQARIRSLSY